MPLSVIPAQAGIQARDVKAYSVYIQNRLASDKSVIPAEAGIQNCSNTLNSRLRGNDEMAGSRKSLTALWKAVIGRDRAIQEKALDPPVEPEDDKLRRHPYTAQRQLI